MSDPVYGKHSAKVCVRPANLTEIENVVPSNTAVARSKREPLARDLACGAEGEHR